MKSKNPVIGLLDRDTLNNVNSILALLGYLELSDGLDPKAEFGLFLIHQVLADALEDVDERLRLDNVGKQTEEG